MNWSLIWAAAGALAGWTSIIAAALWLIVKTTIRAEISAAIITLNGTYVRSQGSTITGREIEGRLDTLEAH